MNATELMFLAIKAQFPFGNAVLPESIEKDILQKAYLTAKKHDIAHIAAATFEKLAEGEIKTELSKQKMLSVFRREQLDFEEERISALLEEEKIDFIPLKGSVIKNYYPEKWMRTSSDIDILVHPDDSEKAIGAITEKLGYGYKGKSLHDHQLYSKGGVHLELHFAIDGRNEGLNSVLSEIWHYATGSGQKKELSSEFLIFYNISHAFYHFVEGGCGIKPFLDHWVLENTLSYEKEKLGELVKKGGIERFFAAFEELAEIWFENKEHSELTEKMENYILSGGVYGTRENLGGANVHRKGGKGRYLRERIFKPKSELSAQYPNLEKRPWLLPFYQVRRWFNLLSKEKRKNIRSEASGSFGKDTVSQMFTELGI